MNNREKGEELIARAEGIIEREISGALEDEDFNMVVRRAQEAVELTLKGALTVLGVDYPKVHDVSRVFRDVVQRKAGGLNRDLLERIIRISVRLSEDRTPSFYGDRSYGRVEAEEASQGARFVYNTVKELLNR
jgi:HEPN domain-containing protein